MRKLVVTTLVFLSVSCSEHPTSIAGRTDHDVAARDSVAPVYEMNSPFRIPNEYLVRFVDNVNDPEALTRAIVSSYGGHAFAVWKGLKGFWGRLPASAIEGLRRHPGIRYIEANTRLPLDNTICGEANCETISSPDGNWGLDRIDQVDDPLDGYYAYSYDGSGVHIWIVDNGVDDQEPDLSGRIDHSSWFTYNGTDPFHPCIDHGTSAAIMAAGNVHGVAKAATINVARVSDDCVNGDLNTGAASSAFDFIADYAARPAVANFSAGHQCGFLGCGQTVDDAIQNAISKGVQVMVSAGNDGNDACDYTPAHVTEAITVGASGSADYRVTNEGWASNYGSCLDLFAPGINLSMGGGRTFGGTSAAAPLVAGVAALYLQQNPTASAASVTQYVLGNATSGTLLNIGDGSPNKLLHSRPAVPAPTAYSATTNPSPARQYNPFSLTITGAGFDPTTAEIVIVPSGSCSPDYDTGCESLIGNGSLSVKTATQLVGQEIFSVAATYDVYVRNGRNGLLAFAGQITVAPPQ